MQIVKGQASGVGNPVYYVGAKTGRDGIHGATMASAEFDEKSMEKRPAVQVGDPFMEKLLLEACLEVMATDACVGVQDMGAAGLSCATSETGSRGGVGIEIDVAKVPQRETGMTPYEIMLSESQERMLLIVKRGREAEVERIFEKWDLHAVRIGEVTADQLLRIKDHGTVVAEVPNRALTDEAPVYRRPFSRPAWLDDEQALPAEAAQTLARPTDTFLALLGSPTVASKQWIYRQYDYMVRTNTIALAGAECRRRAREGHAARARDVGRRQRALLPARSAARRGAGRGRGGAQRRVRRRPADWRDELSELRQSGAARDHVAVRGSGRRHWRGVPRARRADHGRQRQPLQRDGRTRDSADAGDRRRRRDRRRVERADARVSRRPGSRSSCSARGAAELGGSEYLKTMFGLIRGLPPSLDLARERALQRLLVDLAARRLVRSAHDCAEGGLAIALAECCFETGGIGADIAIASVAPDGGVDRLAATLFGESASRVLVSVASDRVAAVLDAARAAGVPAARIGRTGGRMIRVTVDGQVAIDLCGV